MSFSILPIDAQKTTLTFMELPTLGRMSRVDSKLMNFCAPLISEKSKLYLEETYKSYKEDEEDLRIEKPKHPPSLLMDALLTGHNSPIKRTFNQYSNIIGEDIKKIILLFPESINYCHARTRDDDRMSPLTLACYNINIPIEVVEFLFKETSSKTTLYVNVKYLKRVNKSIIESGKEEEKQKYVKIMELLALYENKIVQKEDDQTMPCGCNTTLDFLLPVSSETVVQASA